MKLTDKDKSIISLIMRSRDLGDGWRQCSLILFDAIFKYGVSSELVEVDSDEKRVRLTEEGRIVLKWL